nr:putative ribonuclease H-like domain-containing protein [Tanacetum cinerariifolium]
MSNLTDYKEIDGGYVGFRGNPKGGKIIEKGKFYGKADKGFFVGYSLNSKAFRVFNSRTRIVEENLHIRFSECTPNVICSGPDWLFDIDALTKTINYEPIVVDPKSSHDDGSKPSSNNRKKVNEDLRKNECNDQEKEDNVNSTNNVNTVSLTINAAGTNEDNELPFDPNMSALEEVSIFNFSNDDEDDEKFGFTKVKTASTPMETQKPLLKDKDDEEVDVHKYRSMIDSLMYLTSSRPNIMFAVCACARYQVNPKVSHLHDVKRIFRYLKGQPKLGLWYPKDSPFYLVAYTNSDYAGASLDMKSTTGGCQFFGYRLISWQCKKQTTIVNSTTEAKYVPRNHGGSTAQTRFESVSEHFNDSLLARGNTLQSDKDRLKLNELIALCTTLQNKVLDLKKIKTTESNEIASLKRRVKKLEKRNKSRTHKLKRLYKVGLTARVESFGDEESFLKDASKQGRRIDAIYIDDEITLIYVDHQLAERLQAQEQEELSDIEKATLFQQLLEKRRKHFAAKRAKEKRDKSPTQAQKIKIMCNYLKNMKGYMLKDLKLKEFDKIQEGSVGFDDMLDPECKDRLLNDNVPKGLVKLVNMMCGEDNKFDDKLDETVADCATLRASPPPNVMEYQEPHPTDKGSVGFDDMLDSGFKDHLLNDNAPKGFLKLVDKMSGKDNISDDKLDETVASGVIVDRAMLQVSPPPNAMEYQEPHPTDKVDAVVFVDVQVDHV